MTTRVTTAPTVEPLTLAEAKLQVKEDIVDVGLDARIARLITSCREAVEQELSRSVMLQTLEVTLDEFPDAIRLDAPPIIDVLSVEYTAEDGVATALSPSSYTLDNASEPGWLVPAYGHSWPATQASINAVRVRYRAGYSASTDAATAQAAVPASIKEFILVELATRYKYASSEDAAPTLRHNFAERMLDRFRVYGF